MSRSREWWCEQYVLAGILRNRKLLEEILGYHVPSVYEGSVLWDTADVYDDVVCRCGPIKSREEHADRHVEENGCFFDA